MTESLLIQSIPLFKGLNQAELRRVVESGVRRKVREDQYLYHEADPATTVYVLLQGRIKLTQVTPDGQQIILSYAGPGEAFGVIAVLSEVSYPVSAQAVEDSQVIGWDQGRMEYLMQQYPRIGLNAVRILAGRIREFQDRVRELSTERVERRIARALLRLAQQAGRKTPDGVLINLPLSRQDLAQMTGTTLFTVSRTLSQWETRGIIQAGREQVTIRYPHGLVSIAEDLPEQADR
jgi:CRP-like cAMP-binding protein